jgi:hypothetical protein
MLETDCRHLSPPQLTACQNAPVACNNREAGVDQDGHIEAEGFDTLCDLSNLPSAVGAGVFRIQP